MVSAVDAPARPARGTGPPKPTLRHRLAERGVDRVLLLLIPGVLALGVLFVYPFVYGVSLSFQPKDGSGALGNYKTFFQDSYLRDTIWITLKLAVPAAVVNVAISVPVAFRLLHDFRGKRLLITLLVVPIALGTVLTAEGLLEYFGQTQWFNRTLQALHLTSGPVQLVHNYWGVFASLIITGFPFAFLLTLSYLSGIDPALGRAASTLGAGWWQRFRHVTLPLLSPGLAITFCLSFVLAFSVFPSAQLVGDPAGDTHVISIAAYHAALEQYDYSMGSTIAVIMAVLTLAVVGLVLAWRSRLYRGASGGKG